MTDNFNGMNAGAFSIQDATSWVVLVVDDEPDNLTIADMMLKYAGATVHTAQNGVEGLKLLASLTPSFILLDLSMPHMDGWDMLKLMRADERLQAIPVIAFTAHVMPGDKEEVLQSGFDGYLPKPFRMKTFVPDIQRCLTAMERAPSPPQTDEA
jgi:CheY-like chemotaxis protein